VACTFVDNNVKEGVLELLGLQQETVRLEACTFENNTVLQHNLWREYCADSTHFYSDSSLDVWCKKTSTASKTQPLAALPAGTIMLTAEDPFLAGLQQVCAGRLVSSTAQPSLHHCPVHASQALHGRPRSGAHHWCTCLHTGACQSRYEMEGPM
jgi:hypothetical protein